MDADGANLVVNWFRDLEDRFCNMLRTVPVAKETEGVFLPSLSSIVLETCSLIDTVFRDGFVPAAEAERANILDYAKFYEPKYKLSSKRSVVYHYPAHLRCPFSTWSAGLGAPTSPLWWKNYNSLKHDRLANYRLSTFGTALDALCALHQVISKTPALVDSMLRYDMISFGQLGHSYVLDVLRGTRQPDDFTVLIETELFGTPVGMSEFPDSLENPPYWAMQCGRKFWKFIGKPLH